MSFPHTAEGLTKFLRSQNATTEEIYDVAVSMFDGKYDIYFPNGHIFVLELIIDRWNDTKMARFRNDARIWKLWVLLWAKVKSEDHRKRLLKNLKVVSLIQCTLEETEDSNSQMYDAVFSMLKCVNSCMIMAVPPETGLKLLGKTINVALSSFQDQPSRKHGVISDILTFTDLKNHTLVSKKLTTVYGSSLLIPTLKYLKQVDEESFDPFSNLLLTFMRQYLFESAKDISRTLTLLTEIKRDELTPDLLVLLFSKCVSVGKYSSDVLQLALKLIADIDMSTCADLLEILNTNRIKLSQEYLLSLFDLVFATRDWKIIRMIIRMDIEIGILRTIPLMTQLEACEPKTRQPVWEALVDCHVNARELTKFLKLWEEYCQSNKHSVFLKDRAVTAVISRNVQVLSVKQINVVINELVDRISTFKDNFAVAVLQIVVFGIKLLSYSNSLEFKRPLSKIFEDTSISTPEFWELEYHILEIYDDIQSIKNFGESDFSQVLLDNENQYNIELFFTIFKFYEIKTFNVSDVVIQFMKYVTSLDTKAFADMLTKLFTRWSTFVNSCFTKNDIRILLRRLLDNHSDILPLIFEDQEFFEEENIMSVLIVVLTEDLNSPANMHYLVKIPIQCYTKNTRISVLNRISQKALLRKFDVDLLTHMLLNPTFKSKIETDYNTMISFVGSSIFRHTLENPAINAVWKNLSLQRKDEKVAALMRSLLESIELELSDNFDYKTFSLTHLVLEAFDGMDAIVKNLKHRFVEILVRSIIQSSHDDATLAWLYKVLFVQVKQDTKLQLQAKASVENHPLQQNASVKEAYFVVHALLFDDRLEYILAQYILLREHASSKDMMLDAIKHNLERRISDREAEFNYSLKVVADTLPVATEENFNTVIELLELLVSFVRRENSEGTEIFVRSVSNILTFYSSDVVSIEDTVHIFAWLSDLLTSKPYLFSQYCTELLFPLCSKVLIENSSSEHLEQILLESTRMLSNLLLFHRHKLSNRSHLVNIVLCQLLDHLSEDKNTCLSKQSAKAVSRLICNFCEPSNIRTTKSSSLSSAVSNVKRTLRKQLPVVLLKYIRLYILRPFPAVIRKELMLGIFAVFDLLSQTELNIINASLDNNGRSYFKALHADYSKAGKWRDD